MQAEGNLQNNKPGSVISEFLSPTLLDAVIDLVLQMADEMEDDEFSMLVQRVIECVDNSQVIQAEEAASMEACLQSRKKGLGVNMYWMILGLLAFARKKYDHARNCFGMICLTAPSGRGYKVYELLRETGLWNNVPPQYPTGLSDWNQPTEEE